MLTCPEKSMRKALEKRYPGLCDDVKSVMKVQGKVENYNCPWTGGTNISM